MTTFEKIFAISYSIAVLVWFILSYYQMKNSDTVDEKRMGCKLFR